MNSLLIILALAFAGYSPNDSTDDERLRAFIKKLENLQERQKNNTSKWPMPSVQPQTTDNMPQMDLYAVDHETGLEYSSSRKVIIDRALGFELNLISGTITDLTTGKKSSYKELMSKENRDN